MGAVPDLVISFFFVRVVLFSLLLSACGPVCSGVLVAPDVVLTAEHCSALALRSGRIQREPVQVGDLLTIDAGLGCDDNRPRIGRVLRLNEDGSADLDTFACPGNSGGGVFNEFGQLVGIVVRYRVPDHGAVVQLF